MGWEEVAAVAPGRGEALVRQTAVGLNFIDIYERTGLYGGQLPTGLGREAAGVVEVVGPGVRDIKAGDRVAYASPAPGAYADERVLPVSSLVPVPEGVSDRLAAAALLKGMTAQVLLRRTYKVRKGTVVVVHAAAGGVGSILVQWALHLGARVIAVVGSDAKAATVRAMGCKDVLIQGRDDLACSRQGTHGRAGRACRLRLRRQGHVLRVARFVAPARAHGDVRQCVRSRAADRAARTREARLAVPHAPSAVLVRIEAFATCCDRPPNSST